MAQEITQMFQHDGILEGLEPHDKLATLQVVHYNGMSFPKWLMVDRKGSQRLCNLVSLTLQHCLYVEGDLKLENLTGLRFLSLECCHKLTISDPKCGFHCCKLLESLKLISCNKVGNLPNLSPLTQLHYLEVTDCDNVTTTSELVGLACLPCLREVNTDRLLPTELSKDSPLCRSLHSLNLSAPQQNAGTTTLPYQLRHLSALQTLHIKKNSEFADFTRLALEVDITFVAGSLFLAKIEASAFTRGSAKL